MKYALLAAIAIVLSASAANNAAAMTYKDIAGHRLRLHAEHADREISRRQTGQCVQDHKVHLYERRRKY
jgi:hypothetical protein